MPGPVFLSGETVTLHPPEREDLAAIRRWMNDPRVWRPALDANPMNADLGEEFFERALTTEDDVKLVVCADNQRAATTREDDEPIGIVSLTGSQYGPTATDRARSMELAYHFDPDYQGQGYGSDAASTVVEYAFEDLNLRRVEADVGAFNDASIGLLESLGFEREGARRDAAYYRGDYHDMLVYGLLREDWDNDEE
ncbi:GNAT family N-acetyltransferase [Halobacterium zhouii]|uniref:GNAT family N-acetyltransferase n=1 Tax=Halobacterium zhouii TaxID=2902624 RepID=UPI001E4186FD|nr:GNAT family protein [Halobacterium zhouii]